MKASRARWAITCLAILGTLPYITLKLMWLGGSRVGLNDPDFGTSPVMVAANTMTMAMDAVAILLALAFVTAWGRRLTPWLVLFPMWVGTGLLAPILVIVPLQLVFGTSSSGGSSNPGGTSPIADWVYAMVYGGFMWQGVFLLLGFALYAHHRWGSALGWHRPFTGRSPGPDAPVLLTMALVAAGGLALVTHVWGDFHPPTVNVIGDGLLVLAALVGLALVSGRLPRHTVGRWPDRTPGWVGVTLLWLGSGAMAAWGLYLTVVLLVPNDFNGGGTLTWTDPAAEVLRVIAGGTAAAAGSRMVQQRLSLAPLQGVVASVRSQ
ncbi:hypothetical protein [Nocardioides jensenii]|uniref:hypothetical protein n=1 Tax=Nocardioides jensenii TaxID=1843 RepID=UPI000830FFD7|nr:hypothetical protein [Nocardioides jensenii]